MASIEKVTASGVIGWLRHNNRCIKNDKNSDIDPEKSKLNYSLTPYINIPRDKQYARREEIRKLEYQKYKELVSQYYCYGRKDVNTLVSVVVTLPKEITDPETEEKFFKGVAEFLTARYGNTVSITVHKDEGKHVCLKDEYGNTITGSNGKPVYERREGRAHLHYTFVPTVKINHAAIEKKKNPVKAMIQKDKNGNYKYEQKISAKERIDRKELLSLHPDMNRYLNDVCGIRCNVNSGITAAQGGNKSVAELKAEFDAKTIKDLTVATDRLRGIVGQLKGQIQEQQEALNTMDATVQEKNNIIKQLQYSLKTVEQTNKYDHEKDLVNSNRIIQSQEQRINALEHQIAETKKAYEHELELKQQQIEALQTKNEELEAKAKDLEATQERDTWGQTNTWENSSGWSNTIPGWNDTKTIEEVK